jgi:hypothetical protein
VIDRLIFQHTNGEQAQEWQPTQRSVIVDDYLERPLVSLTDKRLTASPQANDIGDATGRGKLGVHLADEAIEALRGILDVNNFPVGPSMQRIDFDEERPAASKTMGLL